MMFTIALSSILALILTVTPFSYAADEDDAPDTIGYPSIKAAYNALENDATATLT